MGKSKETFNKKEKEKKRLKKRQEKAEKREERKANSPGGGLENMLAYVDEFGNFSDTPPNPEDRVKIDLEDIEISTRRKSEEEMETLREGKIDFMNEEKGYGFIKEKGTGEKFFVHVNNILEEIGPNDKLEFEIEHSPKGWAAIKVKKKVD